MPRDNEPELSEEAEGGPVKSFLEHLEDFRWVLIKSAVTLGLCMLVCLCGAKYVVEVIKWPLTLAKIPVPGGNQVVLVNFGTNHLGNFQISPNQQKAINLGTNRFVSVQIEPLTLGTNQVLGWRVVDDKNAAATAHKANVELINLSPAGSFFVAVQVAFYAGLVLASFPILFFVASFVFPALKMHERKHVFRALFF
ncbi:MAG: twin-arginine translocase subunit TatC, partial [Limisphaerales bacterium]